MYPLIYVLKDELYTLKILGIIIYISTLLKNEFLHLKALEGLYYNVWYTDYTVPLKKCLYT